MQEQIVDCAFAVTQVGMAALMYTLNALSADLSKIQRAIASEK